MSKYDIYEDIAKRTNGDIYIGVVGPVRTGKSTFISKFMETAVLPNIANKNKRALAQDELPQSASGKTIMTSEPKFVPSEAVKVTVNDNASVSVRLIDCVGYLVEGASGHMEEDEVRKVKTPWSEESLPFETAAEIGTRKVIAEHSTIGIVVTTDGSIGEIPRPNYAPAEDRVIRELQALNKPFIIIVNSKEPASVSCQSTKELLEEKYGASALAINVNEMGEIEIKKILEKILLEFPLKNIDIDIPKWMQALPKNSKIIKEIISAVHEKSKSLKKMKDFEKMCQLSLDESKLNYPSLTRVKLDTGECSYQIEAKPELFYSVLSEECGSEIQNEFHLMSYIKALTIAKENYDKMKEALKSVEETGYGVVNPSLNEMKLEEPVMVKQGGRYGVKLKASAPSLHIMKVDVNAEISPIVGSEQQSEELVKFLLSEFESDPKGIWETNMFGKSLHTLVKEGLDGKLGAMPTDTQIKMRKTISRIVNEGKGGVLCILL